MRAAQAWLARERAALAGGVDPRAGRATVRTLLPLWLDERKRSVSAETYTADAALPRLVPTALGALSINAVTDREITRALIILTKSGLAESSLRRFRNSLSSFFAWAVRERMIAANPVTPTRVPHARTPRVEMFPFSEDELERIYVRATARDQRLADLLLIDAWTGLRWSELRAMSVRDFVEVPLPTRWCSARSPRALTSRAPNRERAVAFRFPTASCRSCEPWLLIGMQMPVCS
jgi:integrase